MAQPSPEEGWIKKCLRGAFRFSLIQEIRRFPQRIAGVKVWPELGFTGPGQEIGGLRTYGREGSMSKNSLGSHIPLG